MTNRINLRHLESFREIVRSGSFTKAAKALCVSQPALTSTMNILEEDLGVSLIKRTTRQLEITEDGESFLRFTTKFLDDYSFNLRSFKSTGQKSGNKILLGQSESAVTGYDSDVISSILAHFPDSDLEVVHANDDKVADLVSQEKLHAGIGFSTTPIANLDYIPLLEIKFGILCRQDHPLARRVGGVSFADLDAMKDKIHYIRGHHDRLIKLGSAGRMDWPDWISLSKITCPNPWEQVGLIAKGVGISLIPETMKTEIKNRGVVFKELGAPSLSIPLYLILNKNRILPDRTNKIIDCWQAFFASQIGGRKTPVDETCDQLSLFAGQAG